MKRSPLSRRIFKRSRCALYNLSSSKQGCNMATRHPWCLTSNRLRVMLATYRICRTVSSPPDPKGSLCTSIINAKLPVSTANASVLLVS
eukprot:8277377-Pyramimonas_sp.AAC.2